MRPRREHPSCLPSGITIKSRRKQARFFSAVILLILGLASNPAFAYLTATGHGEGKTLVGSDFSLTRAVDALTTVAILGAVASYSTLAPAITETSSTMDGLNGASALTNPSGADSTSAVTLIAALQASYIKMMSLPSSNLIAGDINSRILTPGVYLDGGALNMAASGVLTLDGGGDPNSLFVFQVVGSIGIGAGSIINLVNGAQANNVYWVSTGAFGGGAGSNLVGNVIANGAANPGAGSSFVGRILSLAALTLTSVTILTPAAS